MTKVITNAQGKAYVTSNGKAISTSGGGSGEWDGWIETDEHGVMPDVKLRTSSALTTIDTEDMAGRYRYVPISIANLSSIRSVTSSGLRETFSDNRSLRAVDISNLTSITGYESLRGTFRNCRYLPSIDVSHIATVTGTRCLCCTFGDDCGIDSLNFTSLSNCAGHEVFLEMCRNNPRISNISFPALTTNSFGDYTNQFDNMLVNTSGCNVHFPVYIKPLTINWNSFKNGFGGTNTNITYDINGGIVDFTTNPDNVIHLYAFYEDYTNDRTYRNFVQVGYVNVDKITGHCSGFNNENYLQLPDTYTSESETIETKICFTTSDNTGSIQSLWYGNRSDDSSSVNIVDGEIKFCHKENGSGPEYRETGLRVSANTKYYLKLIETSNVVVPYLSTDDVNYTQGSDFNRNYPFGINIGQGSNNDNLDTYFDGSYELSSCYIKIGSTVVWSPLANDTSNHLVVYAPADQNLTYIAHYKTANVICYGTVTGIVEGETTYVDVPLPTQNDSTFQINITNNPGIQKMSLDLGEGVVIELDLTSGSSQVIGLENGIGKTIHYTIPATSTTRKETGSFTVQSGTNTIDVTLESRPQENFTVVGNPIIDYDNVASGFDSNNYLEATLYNIPSHGFDLIIHWNLINNDYCPAFGSLLNGAWWGSFPDGVGMFNGSSDYSDWNQRNGKGWYLYRQTDSEFLIYYLQDDSDTYTLSTLPDVSNWTFITSEYDTGILSNGDYRIGVNPDLGYDYQYFRGHIYLEDMVIRDTSNGTIYWRAVGTLAPETKSYDVIGTLTNNNGVYSGFDANNYIQLPTYLLTPGNTFIFKFTTGSDISYFQNILGPDNWFELYVENGSLYAWLESEAHPITCGTVSAETTYWAKVETTSDSVTLSYSTDRVTYTGAVSNHCVVNGATEKFNVGHGIVGFDDRNWDGAIDITNSCIKNSNGNIIW